MRLNAKAARELRSAAEYRNQTVTPSKPEFPGVARFVTMPRYQTRRSVTTSYERKEGVMVRVFHVGTSMAVVGRKGKEPNIPLVMVEHPYPATHTVAGVVLPHPKAGQKYWGPQLEMVPVTKAVASTGPKKIYRLLKRLHKRGALSFTAAEMLRLSLPERFQ